MRMQTSYTGRLQGWCHSDQKAGEGRLRLALTYRNGDQERDRTLIMVQESFVRGGKWTLRNGLFPGPVQYK
jgi:hypothetical protein